MQILEVFFLFLPIQLQAMEPEYFISIYLDQRRPKANGKFPVKIRVFTKNPRKQKFYPTKFNLTKEEFENTWKTSKPKNELKQLRMEMQAAESLAIETAKKINPFNFEIFEKKLFRSTGDSQNVFYHYDLYIKKLKENNQLGTVSSYQLSAKSLKRYVLFSKGKLPSEKKEADLASANIKTLNFKEITPEWLNKYENFTVKTLEMSRTTAGIYLRPLKAIFNEAIAAKDIGEEFYPFGKRKYQIPSSNAVKKALTKSQLKILMDAEAKTPQQSKARDFWFFIYTGNGINVKDLASLRYENIQDGKIVFFRAKTTNTKKTNLKPIVIHLTDFAKSIIDKYGNPNKAPKQLIFSIINDQQTEQKKFDSIKNFTRFINQNIKKLATDNGLPEEISTYWARHSFATALIRSGQSIEFVSEALNHSNIKITQGYFAGFEDDTKKDIMEKLMDFD